MNKRQALAKVRGRVKVVRDHLGWAVAVDGKVVDFFWSRSGAVAGRAVVLERLIREEQILDAELPLV